MALKLSIFTTLTNPTMRGDSWREALNCYQELADELIIINGGEEIGMSWYKRPKGGQLGIIESYWPEEFDWPLIGNQFQKGYEVASGDWVIHMDLDFLFHENNFEKIRQICEENSQAPALSFWKWQFILPDRYNLKSRLVLAINKKKLGDRVRFDSGGDLCQPSLDGKQIMPDDVPEARIPIYNYEKMAKTASQIMDDCGRMDRAYNRYFNSWQLSDDGSGSDESCFNGYIRLLKGRFQKPQEFLPLNGHPKFIKDTIDTLTPKQWGYNGLGLLDGETNQYALGNMKG